MRQFENMSVKDTIKFREIRVKKAIELEKIIMEGLK